MDKPKKNAATEEDKRINEDDAIDRAFTQMESIYKSRCIHPPLGSNVTIREIEKKE
ncbi:MAG: hypothetical protein WBB19_03755 [Desulforhopalus sp.]